MFTVTKSWKIAENDAIPCLGCFMQWSLVQRVPWNKTAHLHFQTTWKGVCSMGMKLARLLMMYSYDSRIWTCMESVWLLEFEDRKVSWHAAACDGFRWPITTLESDQVIVQVSSRPPPVVVVIDSPKVSYFYSLSIFILCLCLFVCYGHDSSSTRIK